MVCEFKKNNKTMFEMGAQRKIGSKTNMDRRIYYDSKSKKIKSL